MRQSPRLEQKLKHLVAQYPDGLQAGQLRDGKRMAFNIGLLLDEGNVRSVCDIGGGVGLFSLGCQSAGLNATLVDDFRDDIGPQGNDALALHRAAGVRIVSRDVIGSGIDFPANSFDAVTSFDSMEHWHHSPKQLFRQLLTALKPGGLLMISVPNCVNLRKRITVPLGLGKWSPMAEWYESEVFRGHVREPDVQDLWYIAHDLNLARPRVFGRNWIGSNSRYPLVRAALPFIDRMLQLKPSLCSDIYLVGYKPS